MLPILVEIAAFGLLGLAGGQAQKAGAYLALILIAVACLLFWLAFVIDVLSRRSAGQSATPADNSAPPPVRLPKGGDPR